MSTSQNTMEMLAAYATARGLRIEPIDADISSGFEIFRGKELTYSVLPDYPYREKFSTWNYASFEPVYGRNIESVKRSLRRLSPRLTEEEKRQLDELLHPSGPIYLNRYVAPRQLKQFDPPVGVTIKHELTGKDTARFTVEGAEDFYYAYNAVTSAYRGILRNTSILFRRGSISFFWQPLTET